MRKDVKIWMLAMFCGIQQLAAQTNLVQNGSLERIDLGEMNRPLLQKAEELTLYVIELEKKMKEGE